MLQAMFGFKKDSTPIVDRENLQVFLLLQQAMQQRAFIDVQVVGEDALYQSLILEMDNDEKTILIDELFPSSTWISAGQALRLNIRQLGGRSLKFQTEVIERYQYDDSPMYVIRMPDAIDYDQRRRHFRLAVDPALALNAKFTAPDKTRYNARVQDISAQGVALQLPQAPECNLHYGSRLENVRFEFAQLNINSALTIKNIPAIINPESSLRIGAEFCGMSANQSRELEQTILQLQRERLRRGEDMRDRLIN